MARSSAGVLGLALSLLLTGCFGAYQVKADHNELSSGWKTLSVFDNRKAPVMNLKLEKK